MDDRELNVLLIEYQHAQELAQHSDAVFWEITSIIWGANTLMLGFVLEAIVSDKAKLLILFTALLGMVLSELPLATYHSSKIGQRIAFEACRDLESLMRTRSQLHNQIHSKYPKHFVQWLVYLVTVFFLAAWAVVGFVDYGCLGAFQVIVVAALAGFLLVLFWRRGAGNT